MLQMLLALLVSTGLSAAVLTNDECIGESITQVETARENFQPFTGKITGTKVRMRTNPSLEGHVVREVSNGELFAVVGKQDGFYAVEPPQGTKGYVFRTFVLDGTVEGSHVNVRLYPDIEAPVVAQLNTGDKIQAQVSSANNKWLEIELPENSRFFIAEEYFDKIGPLEMLAQVQARHHEASHKLSSACLYAQAEIQKPLPQIDLDGATNRFNQVINEFKDIPEIVESAKETSDLIKEVYVQKKLAFLENKGTQNSNSLADLNPAHVDRLAALGIQLKSHQNDIAQATSETLGLCTTLGDQQVTDKMLIWEPIERSLHHLWAATHEGLSLEEFYQEQAESAITLTGMVEAYNRPVKNLPGDFLLRIDNHPVAFLYSTKVNLDKLQGKQVTIVALPRPNNHFAFPSYFVLSVE